MQNRITKNILYFLIGFVFISVTLVKYSSAQCNNKTPSSVVYNSKTKTKIAIKDVCGKYTAISGNEDLVIGNEILITHYQTEVEKLTKQQFEHIQMPSIIILK